MSDSLHIEFVMDENEKKFTLQPRHPVKFKGYCAKWIGI